MTGWGEDLIGYLSFSNDNINPTALIPKDIILTWKNSNVPDHIVQKWKRTC